MLPLIPVSLLLLTTLLIYNYIIYPLFISPLSKIPTINTSSRLSSHWITSIRNKGRTGVRSISRAHKDLGSVILISPTEISLNSLSALRQVYNSGSWEKTPWYEAEFQNYGTPNLVSMVTNKAHGFQKRMISNVYSKSYVQSSTDLDTLSRVLIYERLFPWLEEAMRDNGGVVDAYAMNVALGADFMNAYLFGTANGTDFLRSQNVRAGFMKDFKLKFKSLPGGEAAGKKIEAFILKMCKAAEQSSHMGGENGIAKQSLPHTKPVVYAQLLARLEKESTSPTPARIIAASEMMDQIAAAIETSKVALTYLQWELSQRPDLTSALRKELLTLNPPITFPTSSETPHLPDPKAIDSLPLLNSILKETLRLYTPSPALFPRMCPPSGAVVDGYFIPGGMSVATSAYCLHRVEGVYGSDVESFRPDRWLGNEGVEGRMGEKSEMEKWFWAFGSGGRMCIGSHYAVQMLKLCVAAIYTNYTTSIVDDEGIEPEEAFIASPLGEKLILRLHPAPRDS